ncbi:hypothetical protein BDK92_7211 [Micromonospora pisi]|uniref:Homeodomain-like domain-containing protein n=1 Tax=Micromonospora pisi TaxID=589240 RepID=A0A495JUR3_9ACTN|nr:hypothetical protein [Micromonospora pisi]RKR92733.1 hypothetical protein BDK92_7211 [Micromonospora pisi]
MIQTATAQSSPGIPGWLTPVADFVATYASAFLFGAGAVGAVLAITMLAKFLRTGHAHKKLGNLAVLLATGFAMEGMFEVARHRLDLTLALAVVFCATFEILAAWLGALARHKRKLDPLADIARYMSGLWAVAIVSGIIACTAGNNLTEVLLRLVSPCAAGLVWWINLMADRPATTTTRPRSTWIYTPREICIRLKLIRPGEQDINVAAREHRVNTMLRVAAGLVTADPVRGQKLADKLSRLATDDEDVVTEVAERYRRGATVQEQIFGRILIQPHTRLTAAVTVPAAWWEGILPHRRVRRLAAVLATEQANAAATLAAAHAETERVSGSLAEMTELFETASTEAQRESEKATQALNAQRAAERDASESRREIERVRAEVTAAIERERAAVAARVAAVRAETDETARRVQELDRQLIETRALTSHAKQTIADLRERLADQEALHRRELDATIGRMSAERAAAVATAREEALASRRDRPAPARRDSGERTPKSGGDSRSPEWTDQQLQAFKLRDSNPALTVKDIADQIGVGESTVFRWFQRRKEAAKTLAPAVPTLPLPDPRQPVTAGTNGTHVNTEK